MYTILLVVIVILAVCLCFIVTIQNSKGGGLAAGFASSNQIMGVRKTTDFLEKSTWTLIALIVVLSIATAYVAKSGAAKKSGTVMENSAIEQSAVNPETVPSFDAGQEIQDLPVAE
ncbi:MAG: preprotein translocase subunit SecG [Bacteroidaceae bacterium]|nr:preprotein translocase subunit SecG [Bacteroidaceae bacterium]